MLISCEKLKQWAATIEPVSGALVQNFLMEAEARMKQEIDAAKRCLADYGYKVVEGTDHEYHKI